MNIVLIAEECSPFAQASTLADIVSSLAKSLDNLGNNVKIIIPRYGCVDPASFHIERLPKEININLSHSTTQAMIYKGILGRTLAGIFFIESQNHFSNSREIYLPVDEYSNYTKSRNNFFCHAAVEVISKLQFEPHIIHMFNPGTADIVNILHNRNLKYQHLKGSTILLTIENIAGITPDCLKNTEEAINKAGFVTTVSRSYADELSRDKEEPGISLALARKGRLFLGLDTDTDKDIYNPETDSLIAQNYSKNYYSAGKKRCKEDLMELFNLEKNIQVPLFSIILSETKNSTDLLISALPKIAPLNLMVIVHGKPDEVTAFQLANLAKKHTNIKINTAHYDANLVRKIYAGSDFFIHTSRHTSSGLPVLNAMRYGCIPISHASGVMEEIITDTEGEDNSNGIIFKKEDLMDAIAKALKYYKNKEKWPKLVKEAMSFNFSDKPTAQNYMDIYERIAKIPSLK